MKKCIISMILFTLLIFAGKGFAQQDQLIPQDPQLRIGKLSNGLTYYIRHNNMPLKRADFYIVQKVGSILEQEEQRGLAHFLEHMAFNGTKNFPGNTMVSELEKKGIRFGVNINASTSFDETIYKLINIPVSREGIVDTSLLVLHDWSGFINNNDKDIDDERGVIREEWRISAGGMMRILDKNILPTIFSGTPYANRMPIGLIDVINNFKHQEIRDYYKKWYRPDLQCIMIVGDVDVNQVEAKIKTLFADIPAPVNPAPRNYVKIPDNKEPVIVFGSDKEVNDSYLTAYWKKADCSFTAKSKMSWYKQFQINQVIGSLLTNRFMVIRDQPDPPFNSLYANPGGFDLAYLKPAWNISIFPLGKTETLKALRGLFTETERMRRFGFTNEELNQVKIGAIMGLEKTFNDRNNKENREFIDEYIMQFLANTPAPGIEWEFPNVKKILSELTIDTVNYYAQKIMGDDNFVLYGMTNIDDFKLLPTKETILQTWNEVKNSNLTPNVFKTINTNLLDKKPVPGKIVKTEAAPFGFTQWTLSNGAKVQFKRTFYKEDKLLISGYCPGGYSAASDDDLQCAQLTGLANYGGFGRFSMNDLGKALNGKDVWLNTETKEYSQSVEGSSSLKDRETMFQLAYLKMAVAPRKDQPYYDNWRKNIIEGYQNRFANPDAFLKDTMQMIMANYHPRARSLVLDTTLLQQVDYDKTLQLYRKQFGDASNFIFFVTGNISEDSIRPLIETYIGGLPSTYSHEQPVDRGIYPPKGMVNINLTNKMTTPKTTVFVTYTGENIHKNLESEITLSMVSRVLTIELLKSMREKEGGVYYIGVNGWADQLPKENFKFTFSFSTDPDPVKKANLLKTMYAEIDRLMKEGPSLENVEKAKENYLKVVKEWSDKADANYWNYSAKQFYIYGIDRPNKYEAYLKSVTPKMVQAYAKKVFTSPNRIQVIMDPAVN